MTADHATPDSYFDGFWSTSDDPWDHGGRWYEARKYDLTVAALPRPRYGRSFEPGCGAGFLTQRLATRSDDHLAMERHARGVRATAARCDAPNVTVVEGVVPDDWPEGTFDLIVLSELLYYLDDDALRATLDLAASALAPDGDLVAVHYRPRVAEHVRTGDEVHDVLLAGAWTPVLRLVTDDFRLDVVQR